MLQTPVQQVVDRLRQAVAVERAADADLLDAFVRERSEPAFTELVRRHGPMVWGVCGRMLPNRPDAEDCYQATFLVLIRKAHTVRPRSRVGAWLHGVAYHIALKARHLATRRSTVERQVDPLPEAHSEPDHHAELVQLLDRGLSELPEKYRLPIVLCELEGRTIKDVAHELGCPVGTLAGWLSRGRDLLARRLVKHGIPTVALASILAEQASTAPPALAATPAAVSLAEAAIHALFLAKVKIWLVATAFLVVAAALGTWGYHAGAGNDGERLIEPNAEHVNFVGEPKKVDVPKAKARNIAWAEADGKIFFGLSFAANRSTYTTGERIDFVFHARNDNAQERRPAPFALHQAINGEQWPFENDFVPIFTDAKGKTFKGGWNTNKWPDPPEVDCGPKIAAGASAVLGAIDWHVNSLHLRGVDLEPGKYTVHFERVLLGTPSRTGKLDIEIVKVLDDLAESNTAWGQTVDGVEFGIALKDVDPVRVGGKATLVIKAHNLGTTPTSFDIAAANEFGPLPKIVDSTGADVKVTPRVMQSPLHFPDRTVKLAPRQVVILREIEFEIGAGDGSSARIIAGPGTHRIRYDSVGRRGKDRPTGTLEMTVEKRKVGLLELFDKLKVGMTRNDVESLLGKRIVENDVGDGSVRAYYLDYSYRERPRPTSESPFMPGGIVVTYVDGKLTKKGYNFQWVTETTWCEAVDGVQFGFQFKDDKRLYHKGDHVTFVFKARNTTDKPVRFEQVEITDNIRVGKDDKLGAVLPKVLDAKGKEVKLVNLHVPGDPGIAKTRTVEIAAGDTVTLGQITCVIGREAGKTCIEAPPGRYEIRFDTVCWLPGHKRPTGKLSLDILEIPVVPKRKAGILDLYEKLKPDMTRADVEAVLGKPSSRDLKQPNSVDAFYLGDEYCERALDMHESPFSPSGIYVTYVAGKLTKKSYNPQWVKRPAWGKAVDGVEYGFELKDNDYRYRVGTSVTFVLKARNATEKLVRLDQVDITGTSSGAYDRGGQIGATVPKITDADDKAVKVVPGVVAGIAPPVKVRTIEIGAKATATLGEVTYAIGRGANPPYIDAGAGTYTVRFDTVCWLKGHQRPTGSMTIVVLPKQ